MRRIAVAVDGDVEIGLLRLGRNAGGTARPHHVDDDDGDLGGGGEPQRLDRDEASPGPDVAVSEGVPPNEEPMIMLTRPRAVLGLDQDAADLGERRRQPLEQLGGGGRDGRRRQGAHTAAHPRRAGRLLPVICQRPWLSLRRRPVRLGGRSLGVVEADLHRGAARRDSAGPFGPDGASRGMPSRARWKGRRDRRRHRARSCGRPPSIPLASSFIGTSAVAAPDLSRASGTLRRADRPRAGWPLSSANSSAKRSALRQSMAITASQRSAMHSTGWVESRTKAAASPPRDSCGPTERVISPYQPALPAASSRMLPARERTGAAAADDSDARTVPRACRSHARSLQRCLSGSRSRVSRLPTGRTRQVLTTKYVL